MATILVTGATGTIGAAVVDGLLRKGGHTVRVAVRNPEKASALAAKGAAPVAFSWEDASTYAGALRGAERVFLLTPFTQDQAELGARFVGAAKEAGVTRIVKLSAIGSENEPGIQLGRWHRAVEKSVEASGIPYTFLRPNNFFENFVNFYPPAPDGNIYLPWGEGKCSFIDGRDIAEVAVLALTEDGHQSKAYALTGSEAIGIADAAALIGEATGRTVRYVDVPEVAAREGMQKFGAPDWMIDAMMELHMIDRLGYAATITNDLPTLLGRAPRRFREFAKERAAAGAWK